MTNDEKVSYEVPTKEIDVPLYSEPPVGKELEQQKLEIQEKDKKRKEKRYFSAFRLIVGCLVFLGIIYIIDVICSIYLCKELSKITDSIIEIIKTLLFTLSGYLFARKENSD
ncbi:hypothetical protein AALC16_22610 [Lachnospiraceae bacterium 29-91]